MIQLIALAIVAQAEPGFPPDWGQMPPPGAYTAHVGVEAARAGHIHEAIAAVNAEIADPEARRRQIMTLKRIYRGERRRRASVLGPMKRKAMTARIAARAAQKNAWASQQWAQGAQPIGHRELTYLYNGSWLRRRRYPIYRRPVVPSYYDRYGYRHDEWR